MRTVDSPINSQLLHHGMKYKNHQSPISKLTNLTETRHSNRQTNTDKVLNDRSNQIFIPKNAAKYVQESFERKATRQKEIQQIRKKYYENSHPKNRPASQKYNPYQLNQDRQIRTQKRDQNRRDIHEAIKRQILFTNRQGESFHPISTNKTKEDYSQTNNKNSLPYPSTLAHKKDEQFSHQKSIKISFQSSTDQSKKIRHGSNLDRISQASNSNYETITKTLETLSPERNRVKSSFVMQDNKNKRNDLNGFHYVDSFRNKENQDSVIKETTSVYNQSATRASHVNSYYERDSAKSSHIKSQSSKVQPYILKPFCIQDTTFRQTPKDLLAKPSSKQAYNNHTTNNYPTIYDNFIPKKYTPQTSYKSEKNDEEILTRARTFTDVKNFPIDTIKESTNTTKMDEYHDSTKKRVLKFEDDEKIKEIQKRLQQRQIQFKKREQSLRNKCENQYEKRNQHTQIRPSTTYERNPESSLATTEKNNASKNLYQQDKLISSRPNVQKQIQKLSIKIRQYEDKKKQFNIPIKTIYNLADSNNRVSLTNKPTQSQIKSQSKNYQDARKALQQYRHEKSKIKNSSQVYQITEYQIPDCIKNQESNANYQEELGFHKKYHRNLDQPKQLAQKCDFLQKTKPMYSQRTLPTPKRTQPKSFAFQLFKIQSQADESSNHTSKVTVTSSSSKSNSKQCQSQFEMHRRADDGIQQRKKRLQQPSKKGASQQMKRLVSLLSQQSIHDENFRNCKIWFQNQRDENKWRDLRRQLKQCQQASNYYTQRKDGTISEFQVSQDQNNPFFSVNQQSKFTYQTLIKSFILTKSFWRQNILKRFNKNSLKAEGFTLQKFDLEKKGQINLQDLVRFLNFQSGNFYRNRDLVLIFKRLLNEGTQKPSKALSMDKIFSVIAY